MIEKLIAVILSSLALFFLYRSFKKKASGKCDCTCCTSACPKYKKE